MYDFVDRPGGDTDGAGHGILRNTHRREVFFEENFAGDYGWLHTQQYEPFRNLQI